MVPIKENFNYNFIMCEKILENLLKINVLLYIIKFQYKYYSIIHFFNVKY